MCVCTETNRHYPERYSRSTFYCPQFYGTRLLDFLTQWVWISFVIKHGFIAKLICTVLERLQRALTNVLSTLIKYQARNARSLTSALHIGVSPEELLALAAGAAPKARHALALPRELRPENRPRSMGCRAEAGLTCFLRCQLGEVGLSCWPEKTSTSWRGEGILTSTLGAEG